MQIKIFLELSGEFVNTQVDNENDNIENFQYAKDNEEIIAKNMKYKNSLGGEGYSSFEG